MENWEIIEPIETAVVAPQTFPAELCFGGTVTAQSIVDGLLETYSKLQAYVICKKWAELFAGTTKNTGATDLLKEGAINCTNQKKMLVEIGGRTVAYANQKNLPTKWEYQDSKLTEMEEEFIGLKAKIDARKKFLQQIVSPMPDNYGEMIYPAKKISAGITVSIDFNE